MPYSTDFLEKDLIIDPGLSHKDQIFAYNSSYNKLVNISNMVEKDKDKAIEQNNADLNIEIDREVKRLKLISAPFYLAQEKAKNLKSEGFILVDLDGHISKNDTPSDQAPDPLVSLFMILLDAVIDGLIDSIKKNLNEAIEKGIFEINKPEDFFKLASGLFIYQALRDSIIGNDQGEIAKYVRDPIKRPIEIIGQALEAARKAWENDNGDIGNFIKRL
ncbi:hypothetical protein [Acinetobacter baumannii]|uniref:hypothetical protein n=1 Tax=Acinetobacter baumannii TaxID=470 RepID=UPI0002818E4F|nr:hypothetical protein [Acinetobacter baumannii]EKB36877.1 hypothetical protein W9K_02130 [Acinetobacter baumannii Ab33333]